MIMRKKRRKKARRRTREKEKVPVFPLTCARSVLPDHAMPASFMATQDIKFFVLNTLPRLKNQKDRCPLKGSFKGCG